MRYLIIRLSAFGDVAMTLPVICAVARANPTDQLTLLTQPALTALLVEGPDNLEAIAIDIKHEEHSFTGLMRFAKRLSSERFDMVIDLHNVIRSKYLRMHLRLHGTRSRCIKKPRKLQALITARPPLKRLKQIDSIIDYYAAVFRSAGLSLGDYGKSARPPIRLTHPAIPASNTNVQKIGIAPFAGHKSKVYPLDKMLEVAKRLAAEPNVELLLFGGRGQEQKTLDSWATQSSNISSLAGRLTLPDELAVMQSLTCMVSMDSANMHFASLVGCRVVSVWCGTHPAAGFLGYGQSLQDAIGLDLDCRPCSIYGNKSCFRKDYACQAIPPENIINKVLQIIYEDQNKQTS